MTDGNSNKFNLIWGEFMKGKLRINLLGIYDLILSLGAICMGLQMIITNQNYPEEWLSKLPFQDWVMIGVIGILLFGVGNIIAAIFCFKGIGDKPWLISFIMGSILFISMVAQVKILGEWYLATVQFFLFSIIQLLFSLIALIKGRHKTHE